ncbi:uncharacterized membrane protein YidH (DUF202 family) [Compostimonas suwonensis]|uniref:Uncharacterized membrane protein YidH (DUF202 family) n=2 Tax=Compostimonas suwonensis TaxID=1048394 RepID=A0A2M9BW31_9MICO|nr:uncharacterized membrane protein YidH (DUF202 family) [Compostimonas suwonensis]
MDAATPPARDHGVQPERTALSWNRTALALVVNALLAIRSGWVGGFAGFTVVGAVLLLAAVAAVVYGTHRRRELDREPTRPVPPAAVLAAAGVTLLACAAGVASVLLVR